MSAPELSRSAASASTPHSPWAAGCPAAYLLPSSSSSRTIAVALSQAAASTPVVRPEPTRGAGPAPGRHASTRACCSGSRDPTSVTPSESSRTSVRRSGTTSSTASHCTPDAHSPRARVASRASVWLTAYSPKYAARTRSSAASSAPGPERTTVPLSMT